jgi:AmpD protein
MGNKKVLSKATRELNKTKRFAAPKNIIVDPKGQWAHPGEITRIPSDTITMQGVPYPVMAYPNIGEPQMMYPGGEYYYPGADYVDEYPQMQNGGAIPVIEDAGSYSAEGYWIPDWEAMKKQAKELNAKTVKTKSGSIIYFDSNWDVQNVDDNPQMKRGGTPKSLVKMPKPSKKGLASKKFSRSLDATNKLFTENYLFAKPKSRKRKVFDPNAAYYQEGGIISQEEMDDANNAMMKARLAYAYMHSNPAAQRMVVAPDQPYDFGDGNTGTHYMASMDEYAVPLIQDVNGQLMLGDFGPESAEAMRFDNPDDAQYFAEHYKEITPDESYRKEYPKEDYVETELTPEEIEEYRKGGFIVEDISVPQLTMQKGGDPDPKKKKTSRIEPFITSDPDEYAFRKAAYDDSLHAANKYNPKQPRTSKYNLYKPIVGKSFPGKRASVKRKYIPYIPRPLDTYDVSGESPAWEKFRRENMHLRDRMIENQPIGFVTEESVYDSRAIRTPFGIKTFTLPGEYQDKEFDRKPRYKRPVQPVIFKEPVTHQEKKKPVEHKYPTSRKPVVDNTKQKPPEGKIVVGQEEVQQLDPNTGVVTTVINPVYEDAMMPMQTLPPARVNHTLQKFIGEPFPTRVQEEIPEEELLEEEIPEEEIPEEEMYGEEEVDGEYVDAGRKRLFPDIYVDTRGRKLKYTTYRLRKPGHSGDLIKKKGVDYMYFPKIERGPSTHFWMDYKQEGGAAASPFDLDPEHMKRYLADLRKQENSIRKGYKNGMWYPHASLEGGADTIAYGHKLTPNDSALRRGITEEQALKLQEQDVLKNQALAKKQVDKQFGTGTFDNLPQDSQMLLIDYQYNLGTLSGFPKFVKGVVEGNKEQMLAQHTRFGAGKPLTKRNEWTVDVINNMVIPKPYDPMKEVTIPLTNVPDATNVVQPVIPEGPKEAIELELTPEEIKQYQMGGYIIEEIDEYQDGGIVELDGYQFKQDAQGNWRYTSGAPVTDRALIQRLTYEAKPIGKPVVQAAPKVTPTPIRTQQVASKKNSPSVADQKEYKQAQREQQQYDFNQDKQQAFDEAIAKTKLQSVQPADWVFAAPMFAPMALEGLGALAATQIPGTGISLGTAANTVGGIHGVTQIPQRVQDWEDVAAGKKDWREATAESLMTGLELYGGYDAAKTLLPQTYKINPWALKQNPEMYLYRTQPKDFVAGLTEEEYLKSLITDKIIKGEEVPWHLRGKLRKMQIEPEPFREALNKYHGQWFDKNPARMEFYMKGRLDDEVGDILRLKVPKSEGDAFNLKNFPEAQKASLNYESEFIVPRERLGQAEKFSTEDWKRLMQEDKAFNTPHWLKGYPKQLPGSPNNSFSIFPKKPIPLSERSLEFGKASKSIGSDQMPDDKWLPKQEHEWFNPENKKLHDELTASLEEQAKRSEELSNFDAAAAMDKINESKLGPGVFRNLIMGDDLLWKTEEYLGTPYIPYTRRDLLREGNKLYPRVQYKPMDLETKSKLMQDITLGKSHERLLPAQQMLKNLPKWTGPIDPKTFAMEFRGQILGPTGKPITIENIEKASPRQLELWKQQVIDNYANQFRDAIRQQEQASKFIPRRSNLNLNREGGIVMELSDNEIEQYKKGGWIVEEVYDDGGTTPDLNQFFTVPAKQKVTTKPVVKPAVEPIKRNVEPVNNNEGINQFFTVPTKQAIKNESGVKPVRTIEDISINEILNKYNVSGQSPFLTTADLGNLPKYSEPVEKKKVQSKKPEQIIEDVSVIDILNKYNVSGQSPFLTSEDLQSLPKYTSPKEDVDKRFEQGKKKIKESEAKDSSILEIAGILTNPIMDYFTGPIETGYELAGDAYDLVVNGLKRKARTYGVIDDSDAKVDPLYKTAPLTIDQYYTNQNPIRQQVLDVPDGNGRTFKQQVVPLSNITLGYRNRGEYDNIKTPGLELTTFHPFVSNPKDVKENTSVFAIDDKGNLHTGSYGEFKNNKGWKFSRTYMNKITDITSDFVDGSVSGNPGYKQPKVKVLENGKEKSGSLNILTKGPGKEDYYGSIQGGRVLFVNPKTKEQFLVSGSAQHIRTEFKRLKGNAPYLEAWTLDNGTYSRGLSYKDGKLTPERLKKYDNENTSGGSGLYILDYKAPVTKNKYQESYVKNSPNVRTVNSESYRSGRPLKNEIKNVVLHHTAFTDEATSEKGVYNHFMNPKSNASAHVVIERNGKRTVYASPEQVAFHAGVSSWNGRKNVNDFAIGVEFQGDTNKMPLTDAQIESFVEYYAPIAERYNLSIKDIITHAMIAPGRKPDITDMEYKRILNYMKQQGYK